MKRSIVLILVIFALAASGKEYALTIIKGGAEIVKSETGEQSAITANGMIAPKDMLSLTDGQQIALTIEKNAVALIKGPASLTLTENGNALSLTLDEGQLLLSRQQPYELSALSIVSKGFSFVPMGTCVAVKTTPAAPPTAAVLEGKVRMQAPSGEAVVVDQGNYGSMNAENKLSTGALSPRAIESLNEWRAQAPGATAAPAATASNQQPAGSAAVTATPGPAPQNAAAAEPTPAPAPLPPATTVSAPAPVAAAPSQPEEKPAETAGQDSAATPDEKRDGAQKIEKTPPPPSAAKWEISAGTATIDNEQWTRVALGVDVPLWKFGIFFDLEFFVDKEGQFSDKGWNFKDDWAEALSRKIRYIRFGQEGEPLFIKFGGLSSVTMGYGFLVDRFSNMLHYPDQKMLGLQFDLNDISPFGVTLQTLIADFKDFDYDGGLAAARLGFRPLKTTGIPIVKGIMVSGSYATDLNQYAPARKWDFRMTGKDDDRDEDNIKDSSWVRSFFNDGGGTFTDQTRSNYLAVNQYDTIIEHRDQWASHKEDPFGLIGADIGIPIIATSIVGLDVYGQAALRDDNKHGWGIGAPGIALKIWRFWANVEYRRIQGKFQPGYFGTYYLDERLLRDPYISTKEDRLVSDTLNGVYGRLGFNIADILIIDGSYQYMAGNNDDSKDQRFEASGALGDLLLQKIPKLSKAEVYFYKSRIGNENDEFFEKTPYVYFGYRAGFEISEGASLIWDARYGYMHDDNGKLVPNNNISVMTAITF